MGLSWRIPFFWLFAYSLPFLGNMARTDGLVVELPTSFRMHVGKMFFSLKRKKRERKKSKYNHLRKAALPYRMNTMSQVFKFIQCCLQSLWGKESGQLLWIMWICSSWSHCWLLYFPILTTSTFPNWAMILTLCMNSKVWI